MKKRNAPPDPLSGQNPAPAAAGRGKKAAALKYKKEEDRAPVLVARGSGQVAEKIIQLAREHNIPLHEDPKTIELLCCLDLGDEIPPELYKAVARILVFIYGLSKDQQPQVDGRKIKGGGGR